MDDWPLIEASFASQYGIRLRQEGNSMSWNEFSSLLSGLLPETPLGRIVTIRSETDEDTIKHFNKDQQKIRNEWLKRKPTAKEIKSKEDLIQYNIEMENLNKMLQQMFG